MTLGPMDLALYAGALLVLFLTPGPVWLALAGRALSGGFASAWPLALGVAIGDAIWPLLAILGVSWIVTQVSWALIALRYFGAILFLVLGVGVLRNAGRGIDSDSRLMRPGRMAGFLAGLAVIAGNPKAILFYMGILPGFFDLEGINAADIGAVMLISVAIPLLGNLALGLFVDRARRVLSSPRALRRANILAGSLMICVGLLIPFF